MFTSGSAQAQANGVSGERQSQLFDDLRNRNERRAHGARPIVPEISDRPESTPWAVRGPPVLPTPDDGASLPTLDARTLA